MEKATTTFWAALTAALLLVIGSTNANAAAWRINNDVTKKAHFTSINEAMSSADVVAGDTLYLDPGCVNTSTHTINKQITLIGTGYASTGIQIATVGTLVITAAHVKVEGVYISGGLTLRADYITIERCKIKGRISNDSNSNSMYATFRQCRIYNYVEGQGTTHTATQGWTIENCIINSNNSEGTVWGLYNPTITNNIIWNESTSTSSSYYPSALRNISGGVIRNNILLNVKNTRAKTLWSVENSIVQHNVLSQDEATMASTYPDNTCLDMGYTDALPLLFTLDSETSQYRYRLKEDSPARGAGIDGEDCGVFAGSYPFVDNGYPQGIPVITSSAIGVRAVNGKVSVKQTVVIQND